MSDVGWGRWYLYIGGYKTKEVRSSCVEHHFKEFKQSIAKLNLAVSSDVDYLLVIRWMRIYIIDDGIGFWSLTFVVVVIVMFVVVIHRIIMVAWWTISRFCVYVCVCVCLSVCLCVCVCVCVWLNTQTQYRGIDDTPTEKVYQINNGLDDTLHDRNRRIIQWAVSNWRWHWRRIQQQSQMIFWIYVFSFIKEKALLIMMKIKLKKSETMKMTDQVNN